MDLRRLLLLEAILPNSFLYWKMWGWRFTKKKRIKASYHWTMFKQQASNKLKPSFQARNQKWKCHWHSNICVSSLHPTPFPSLSLIKKESMFKNYRKKLENSKQLFWKEKQKEKKKTLTEYRALDIRALLVDLSSYAWQVCPCREEEEERLGFPSVVHHTVQGNLHPHP